jgi:proline iminopeptidase
VVLHGGPGFDQGYLRPGLAPLSSEAQLVFVDLRGQGRSSRPPVQTCTLE